MRIAMLGHKRMPSREGGVEVVVEELATRMAALGHDVTVYSRKGHNVAGIEYDEDRLTEYKGVRIKQVATLDIKGFAALTSSYAATRAAIADKPDVIHFHAEGPCAMVGMAKRSGIRTVATIHGLDWQRAKWGKLASAYIKHGESVAAHKADEIIVLSRGVQNYFMREYQRETTFIPNGVNPAEKVEPTIIASKYGLNKDGYILYLGRIVPEKGVHYLVDAFKCVNTGKKLVIAGGSSDSEAYFDNVKAKAAADDRIVFTGFVQGPEIAELYSNATVYVLPSDLEGMPMSLLEAMSYGCCCLTSDIPECSDVLKQSGKTFKSGDSFDLASKLDLLLEDETLRASLGVTAKKLVTSEHDWNSVVRRTLDLYEGGGMQ